MIYFVRHGESEANEKGLYAGQRENSPLTEKGREQAKACAEKIIIDGIAINEMIVSPLKRTQETAEVIADVIGFDRTKIVTDPRVIEYDMGDLTGTPIRKIPSVEFTKANNAENPNNFHDRVYNCLKELSSSPKNILIVSHAGVGRMLEAIKTDTPSNLYYDFSPYANGSVTKIDWIK